MIDVHALASAAIQSVNPDVTVTWVHSAGGYTTNAAGHRVPIVDRQEVRANVQGLSAKDLEHTDGLNIEGVLRAVHLYGNVQGIVRATQQGGDTLEFPETPGGPMRSWRVTSVMETWPTWCRVIVTMQNP